MSDSNKLTRQILEQQFGFKVTGHYEDGVYYDINGDGTIYLRSSNEGQFWLDDTMIEISRVSEIPYLIELSKRICN